MKNTIELMKPRYKVIQEYPLSDKYFKLGDILYEAAHAFGFTNDARTCGMGEITLKKYPAIFKPLQWWEERDFDLTGMYVRFGELDKHHAYYKLKEKIEGADLWIMIGGLGEKEYTLHKSIIATETEYNTYKNNL